ncbi:hypothetical protein ACWF95_38675 [Streptomyces vinaceus]
MLTLRPRELHEGLARAGADQKSDNWKNEYALSRRPRGNHQPGPRHHGYPPTRYRGPVESPPPARLLRHRAQRNQTLRVLDQQSTAEHPHQPPRTPRLPPRRMTPTNLRSRVGEDSKTNVLPLRAKSCRYGARTQPRWCESCCPRPGSTGTHCSAPHPRIPLGLAVASVDVESLHRPGSPLGGTLMFHLERSP